MIMPSIRQRSSESSRVLSWQKDVARNVVAVDTPKARPSPKQHIDHSSPHAVVISRSSSDTADEGRISTRSIVGTLLGTAAGASVAHAIAYCREDGRTHQLPYRVVEDSNRRKAISTPPDHFGTREFARYSSRGHHQRTSQAASRDMTHSKRSSALFDLPRQRSSRSAEDYLNSHRPDPVPSHTGRTIARTNHTKILLGPAYGPIASSNSRREQRVPPPSRHAPATRDRAPFSVDRSRRSSSSSSSSRPRTMLYHQEASTIAPGDSVSQVSTRRSSHHHHTHHRRHDHQRQQTYATDSRRSYPHHRRNDDYDGMRSTKSSGARRYDR